MRAGRNKTIHDVGSSKVKKKTSKKPNSVPIATDVFYTNKTIENASEDDAFDYLYQKFYDAFDETLKLIIEGRISEVSRALNMTCMMGLHLSDIWNTISPQFKESKTTERILKRFSDEYIKRKAVPNREAAKDRKSYKQSCRSALLEVIILYRAGWRQHWHSPTDLPSHPFGSPEGSKDWRSWSMNFLQAIHKKGLIRANPNSKAANGEQARGRRNVQKSIFDELYKLSPNHLEMKLDLRIEFLNAKVESEPGRIKTFLQKATMEHCDFAPTSRVNELVEHLCTPSLEWRSFS